MTTYIMTLLEHLLAAVDRFIFGTATAIPAGPEVGPIDDAGSFCTGYPTGETALVFVSVQRRAIFPAEDLALLEEIASGSLGPSDPRLLGRVDTVPVFACSDCGRPGDCPTPFGPMCHVCANMLAAERLLEKSE